MPSRRPVPPARPPPQYGADSAVGTDLLASSASCWVLFGNAEQRPGEPDDVCLAARYSAAWRAAVDAAAALQPRLAAGTLLPPGGCRPEEGAHAAGSLAHRGRVAGQPPPQADLLRAAAGAAAYATAMDVAATLVDLMWALDQPPGDAGRAMAFALAALATLLPASAGLVALRSAPEARLLDLVDRLAAEPGKVGARCAAQLLAAARAPRAAALRRTRAPPRGLGPDDVVVAPRDPRLCAMPSCDSTEEGGAVFQVCPRCGAAYCCAEHQKDDWKAHKRGCKPPLSK